MNTVRPGAAIPFDETPYVARHACSGCDHFSAPTSDRKQMEKVGGTWRGDCLLQPVAVKKTPDDRCGQHSLLVAERAAAAGKAVADAFAPIIAHGLAGLAAASEKAMAVQAELLGKLAQTMSAMQLRGESGSRK